MRRFSALIALPLVLAACQPTPGENGEGTPPEEEPVAEEASLDFQGTGIIVPPQNGFEQLQVPFGSNRAATEATLGNILGEATAGSDGTGDCWLQTVDYDGLTLSFNDADEFVGYIATAPWVGNGTRADMLSNAELSMVEDSTLGEEFLIGPEDGPAISGMFAGEGEDAAVEALWAGENCIMR